MAIEIRTDGGSIVANMEDKFGDKLIKDLLKKGYIEKRTMEYKDTNEIFDGYIVIKDSSLKSGPFNFIFLKGYFFKKIW